MLVYTKIGGIAFSTYQNGNLKQGIISLCHLFNLHILFLNDQCQALIG